MNTSLLTPEHVQSQPLVSPIRQQIGDMIDDLIVSLPDPKLLTSEERRGIIARYTSVLEGNFIYWMTAALLSVQSEESRPILLDNLHEEVRDAHPVMLRKFAIAAHAYPTDLDALAVNDDLTNVRRFLGQLSGVRTVLMMAYFEGYIQRFMAYLADLAKLQGSAEMEYTDVHGVCDIAHTEGLFRAFDVEMALNPKESETDLFEGVYLLQTLLQNIVDYPAAGKLSA